MHKSLYSLILMDDVVDEIDRMAARQNTSRSNLVNQILADYVSYLTPEKRITQICRRISEMIADSQELIPIVTERNRAVSVKSSLDYKYRPTIRYEVQLYREPGEAIGELHVLIRTQSAALLLKLTEFFRILKTLEERYIVPRVGPIRYELIDAHFTRSISIPWKSGSSEADIGEAISRYVEMLDHLMKQFVSAGASTEEIEALYVSYLQRGVGLI